MAEPKTRHISLGFMSQTDVRKPRLVRLMVQDEEFRVDTLVDLTEHEFTALMAGQSIKVECEI